MSILHIASKDLIQIMRNRMTFLFLLLMPIGFTFLFGFAFNRSGSADSDSRLPVGFSNLDGSPLSLELERLLEPSTVIRLELDPEATSASLEKQVTEKDLAAALVIPAGYGASLGTGTPLRLVVFADAADSAGLSAQTEIQAAANRLVSALRASQVVAAGDETVQGTALTTALAAWQDPPIRLAVSQTSSVEVDEPEQNANPMSSFAHSAPGMMLQFAIAGLLTCAQVIVAERKNRCLQRMLTTATNRVEILLGHYLAVFMLIFTQFILLIAFGQWVLKLNYLAQPAATLLVTLTTALCIAALGLLIGSLARSDEQAVTFSLIPMFVFAGLGGAWVPLEVTGATFQAIGHLTPVAWAMDGFKGILLRGLALGDVLLPAAALAGYAILFFLLASWRFKFE